MPNIVNALLNFVTLSLISNLAYANQATDIDQWFSTINSYLATVIFVDLFPGEPVLPFIVAWLICAGFFLTIRMKFVNLRMMRHAFLVIAGRYRTQEDRGDVTSFQALTTALSATVGLGNIAGVAIAISLGGPGATFWMIIAGFIGMSTKFTEASLAQMYREFRSDGRVMGGAMEYLSKGFAEFGMPMLGRILAGMFAILTILGSFGAGSAFQVSQSMGAVQQQIPFFADLPVAYGITMAFLVGIVIIGGIRRIAYTAEAIVPFMVIIYLLAGAWIIANHVADIPMGLMKIFTGAFNPEAVVAGGVIGTIVQGFKRAAFSNEAGLGSAAIAHSAAAVKYPIRQGMVALYEPFIDTIVICTMTALVIVFSGVYDSPDPAIVALREAKNGAALTGIAFAQISDWFPIILAISVFLFAYSTMISWSYYGERCWSYLFGESTAIIYRVTFVIFTVLASIASPGNMLDFTDLLVLAMSFPNIIGLYLLSGKVKRALDEYTAKLKTGELDAERK